MFKEQCLWMDRLEQIIDYPKTQETDITPPKSNSPKTPWRILWALRAWRIRRTLICGGHSRSLLPNLRWKDVQKVGFQL